MIERASLSRTVGNSVLGAAAIPVRLVLWLLHGLFWLAIPAFLVAAIIHYSVGNINETIRDGVFLVWSMIVVGLFRFLRRIRS